MHRLLFIFALAAVLPCGAQQAPVAPAIPASSTGSASPASPAQSSSLPAADQPVQAGKPAPSQTGSPEIARAEAAIEQQDWKAAEPILESWLASHPTDARALFDLGYIADAQNRDQDAIGLYKRALGDDPQSFEAQISLGLLLARTGKSAEARPELEKATALDPGAAGTASKARAWRAMARIDLAGFDGKVDFAQASIDLIEALKLSPETPEDTLMAASLAESNGDQAAAEREYRRVLKADPDSAPANSGLAHLLIAQKKYPEAEQLLKDALAKTQGDPALTAQLAAVLVAEDKAEALPLLQQYHQQHPDDSNLTRMLAQVSADAGEYTESDQLYTTLIAANPKDADLQAGHGQNLIRLHRYPEAQKAFQNATSLDETNGEAWNGLAFASFQTHQPEITISALTARSKYLPDSPTILFLWATAYDTLHNKKQASAYYRRFLDSAQGKLPDQEWQAKQRLKVLDKSP